MRVTHVVSGILGGAGRVVHELAGALAPDVRSSSVLFSTAAPDPTMVATLRASNETVDSVTKLAKIGPLAVMRLAAALRRTRPDALLLHDFTAYVWGTMAARLVGRVPLIAVEHSNCLESELRRRVRRLFHPAFAATVCVSPALEARLRAIGITARLRTIRNGIDQGKLAPLSTRARFDTPALRLLTVGRLDAPKDHATLIAAIARLRDEGVPVELRIVGEGSLGPSLRADVAQRRLDDVIRFEGATIDLPPYLERVDVVVLPSLAEGLPMALIEGMAAGCLAIASDVGAVGELLQRGAAGVLVPPRDVDALARALADAQRDPTRARALAAAGTRHVAEHYSAARMADEYRGVLTPLRAA